MRNWPPFASYSLIHGVSAILKGPEMKDIALLFSLFFT